MPLDFSKIAHPKPDRCPVDPMDLFQRLKMTDGAINDLWFAQGEALRDWHRHQQLGDIAILL